MKLQTLRMQNFRQHARSEISFAPGITAIIGANGSGKTTVLEAIAWALYGQPAIRGVRDGIRFLGAPARAPVEVELEFELAGHRYRVTRGLTTAAVYLDGSESAVANSISAVNDLLGRRLGMSRAEFFNTYFTGQKDLAVMASMGPADRARFLSRVLGYERLRGAQDLARESRRQIGARISELRSGLGDPDALVRAVTEGEAGLKRAIADSTEAGTRHAVALSQLRTMTPAWEQLQREREGWQRHLAEMTIVERELESLRREIDRLAGELVALAAVHDELATLRMHSAPLDGLRAELARLDELFGLEGRRAALLDNAAALADEIRVLTERRDRLEKAPALEEEITVSLETARRKLEEIDGELEANRTAWVRDVQEAETKRAELRRQYADYKAQLERVTDLGAEGVCPTCNRVLGASYQGVVEQLEEKLETLRVDGQYFAKRREQLAAPPQALTELEARRRDALVTVTTFERRLAKVQAAVQELPTVVREIATKDARRAELLQSAAPAGEPYDAERHAAVRAEIERLAPMATRALRLEASIERRPMMQQESERLANELAAAMQRREALVGSSDGQQFSEEKYLAARTAHAAAAEAVRTSELAVVAAQAEVRAAQQRLDQCVNAKREHDRIAERLAALDADRLLHDELDQAFRELRTDLNDALRPELSEIAGAFLASLTDDRYTQLELDENYDLIVLEDGVAKPVISGGEEDLANLVLRLAISQMIADRSGQPFSLLILDEVFGSLDAARRENVLELLHRLEDRFEQVILITHIESVREGVDRVIAVRYDEERGCSVVESSDALIAAGATLDVETEVAELA